MGGRLKTDRVCRDCNHRAGTEIDAPFMEDLLIFSDRQTHIPGRTKLAPTLDAKLDDGTPVDIRMGRRRWNARVRPAIERDGNLIRIRANDLTEYNKLVDRARKQLAAEGKTIPDGLTEIPDSAPIGEIRVTSRIEGVVWLRMAAKVTLAAFSTTVDESWVTTSEAAKYRGWLWDEKPRNEDGTNALAFPVEANRFESAAARPGEHLLYFYPRAGGDHVVLSVVYFGTLIVRARVAMHGHRRPDAAWRMKHGSPATRTTFDQLLMEAAVNQADEPAAEGDDD